MSNRTGTIYMLYNDVNDKVYIGQTTKVIEERFKEHKKACNNKGEKEMKLYRAMNDIGVDKFHIKCLECDIPISELELKEIYYIEAYDSFHNGYNATIGGKGGKLIEEKWAKSIIDDYLSGLSCNDIAKTFHVDQTTINRLLTSHGITLRHDGNKVESFDLTEFISIWENKNIMLKEMALHFRVHPRTLKRYAIALGLNRKGYKKQDSTDTN